jgi:hypothetical protein
MSPEDLLSVVTIASQIASGISAVIPAQESENVRPPYSYETMIAAREDVFKKQEQKALEDDIDKLSPDVESEKRKREDRDKEIEIAEQSRTLLEHEPSEIL